MEKYIIANWKMNPETADEAKTLFDAVKRGVAQVKNTKVVICPPAIYLPLLKGLSLGAQSMSYAEQGAYTGEISPLMLKNAKVQYVLVGHSESRKYLNETNEAVNKKLREALVQQLAPILCVGETAKEIHQKERVLEREIGWAFREFAAEQAEKVIIAYEPIWAIGTGKNCSVEETLSSIAIIRKLLEKQFGARVAEKIPVLYGGSSTPENAQGYLEQPEIAGLLVGGASLKAESFLEIISIAEDAPSA